MDKLKNHIRKNKFIMGAILIGLLVGVFVLFTYRKQLDQNRPELQYDMFSKAVLNEEVESISYSPYRDSMVVFFKDGSEYKVTYPDYEDFRKDMLEAGISLKKSLRVSESALLTVIEVLILVAYIGIMFTLRRGFGNLKERDLVQKSNVKFNDIIGLEEILEDISIYVSLIKNPSMGEEIGAKTPKGLLLAGAPGTGKTLIAKAIAGEADVPFISVSGSEFTELYKGVGARRVRQLFKIARKNAPCILFIDEIDAIGADRMSDDFDSEDTQTINQLLKEMDGFSSLEGVFVLAATNCPEKLDGALKRAGRFDRQVNVNPPRDWKLRKQMFEYYLKDYKVATDLDIDSLAKAIGGFTGADIAMICNEASLVAIMKKRPEIDRDCIEEAIDKKVFNGNRSKSKQHERDREIVAYHEAGHAVMKYLCGEPISRASIAANTSGVGGAVFGEDKDTVLRTSSDIRNSVMVCYAGRSAEIIKCGEPTTGAENDITQATELLMSYVMKYGFDNEIRALDYNLLLKKDLVGSDLLNSHMQELAKDLEDKALEQLKENFSLVERLAEKLLENETMTGAEIIELFN